MTNESSETITPETGGEETLRDKVLHMAKHGDAADLREVWQQVIQEPPGDLEFYNQLLRSRATTYDTEAIRKLLEELATALEKRQEWQTILRIVDVGSTMWPESDAFRSAVVAALLGKYADTPNIEEIIEATGLQDETPLDKGLKRFKGILRLTPGRAYQHAMWGVGVVKELDLKSGKVTFDFPEEKGRVLTLAGVRDFLVYLQPTSFLALRATDPDRLISMAEENPAALVRMALEQKKGKLKQSELKTMLLNGVLQDSKWNTWWTRARGSLKMDPMIDFDSKGGAHAEISLRSKPKSFEEEVQDLFFSPDSAIAEKVQAGKLLQDSVVRQAPSPDLLRRMLNGLNADYTSSRSDLSAVDRLQMAMLAEDLRALDSKTKIEAPSIPVSSQLIGDFDDSYTSLASIESADHAARALRLLMERDGERGFELAAELFPLAPSRLAQVIWRALDPEHHKDISVHAAQALLERPLENSQTYLWAIKQIADGNWAHLEEYLPLPTVVRDMLDNLDSWEKLVGHPTIDRTTQANAKMLMSRVKTQLEHKHFALLCAAVEKMDLDQARRLRRVIQNHPAMNDTYRSAAERQLVLTRRELLEDQAAPLAPGSAPATEAADAPHYTTARAREEKLAELNELMTVRIPHNSAEIEKARSEGDLKENAGYIYAKEQQKLLMQQSLQLQQHLQTARVFDRSKVTTSTISFGTAFVAENMKKGSKENYTVLGRFETDPDKNIVSYQSPFMQQFVGKSEGDEVQVKHPDGGETRYKILSITNALEDGSWDMVD